jgi:branched-chain amino acid aminotransferase
MLEKQIKNAYYDGKLLNYHEIQVWLLSHSLNYATAVIDSFRFYKQDSWTYAIWVEIYVKRFLESVVYRGYELDESQEKIIKILQVLLYTNKHLQHPYVRMIAYISDDSTNIFESKIHFWITIFDLFIEPQSLHAQYSSFLRKQDDSHALKLSSNYSKNIIEQMKHKKQWFDISIFLGENEEILECLSENIFYVKNNIVYTSKTWNIVNGVNRKILQNLLPLCSIEIVEKHITKWEIEQADEVFITGTATGIRSISQIWDIIIGEKENYPLTTRVKKIFNNDIFWYTCLWEITISKIL